MTSIARWIARRVAAESTLTRGELAELAVELGREDRFWSRHVRHDPEQRYFHQLYRDPNLDVWLICWLDAQDTGYHDHDVSSGAVHVLEGVLIEDYLYRDARGWIRERSRERPAGSVWHFDPASIHGLRHPGGPPTTSIHVYSPALWRMGHYEAGPLGLLRQSITYADEAFGDHGPEPARPASTTTTVRAPSPRRSRSRASSTPSSSVKWETTSPSSKRPSATSRTRSGSSTETLAEP